MFFVDLGCHLTVPVGQLHQGSACGVLGFLRPRLFDQRIQCGDNGRVFEGFTAGREERDLLDAFGVVSLHNRLDGCVSVFSRVLRVQQ